MCAFSANITFQTYNFWPRSKATITSLMLARTLRLQGKVVVSCCVGIIFPRSKATITSLMLARTLRLQEKVVMSCCVGIIFNQAPDITNFILRKRRETLRRRSAAAYVAG